MAGDLKQQYPMLLAWARRGWGGREARRQGGREGYSMCCGSRQGQKDKIKKGWGGPHTVRTNIRGGQRAGQSLQAQGEWHLQLPVRTPYPASGP